jgi:PAS domain S-box-containing protein
MFESAEDKMLLLSPDGMVLDANPAACAAYGFSREELVGRSVKEVVHPSQHMYIAGALQEAAEGRSFRRESVHLRRNGATFPIELQLSPIVHRRRTAILAAIRDITARREAEQALRESEIRYRNLSESLEKTVERKVAELQQAERLAAIGRMVSIVAHEIRNPLQNISMGVDAIKRDLAEDKNKLEILGEIDYGIGLLNNIVTELLEYSRPIRLHYSSSTVSEIVSRSLKLSVFLPNINFLLELEQAEKEISVDIPRIIRLMINIITNAIEAMPDGGELRISSQFHETDGATYLKLIISDTGVGIDENVRRHLFEPFFTTKTRGTGLGLSICKKIVDAHKGSMNITSKVGEGTVVEITLPVRKT